MLFSEYIDEKEAKYFYDLGNDKACLACIEALARLQTSLTKWMLHEVTADDHVTVVNDMAYVLLTMNAAAMWHGVTQNAIKRGVNDTMNRLLNEDKFAKSWAKELDKDSRMTTLINNFANGIVEELKRSSGEPKQDRPLYTYDDYIQACEQAKQSPDYHVDSLDAMIYSAANNLPSSEPEKDERTIQEELFNPIKKMQNFFGINPDNIEELKIKNEEDSKRVHEKFREIGERYGLLDEEESDDPETVNIQKDIVEPAMQVAGALGFDENSIVKRRLAAARRMHPEMNLTEADVRDWMEQERRMLSK